MATVKTRLNKLETGSMSSRFWALLAATGTATIYGLNHTVAKVIMPHYVGAFGFVFMRLSGAAILFWLISLFLKKEKIDRGDFMKILPKIPEYVSNATKISKLVVTGAKSRGVKGADDATKALGDI